MDIKLKRSLYSIICFTLSLIFIGCNGKILQKNVNNKINNVYKNKNMGIEFSIPETWNNKYKVIHMKDSLGIKKVIFKKKDKKYNIVLIEFWMVNEEELQEWKNVRKLDVIKKTDFGILVYSKPRLESIMENIGTNVGSRNKKLESEIREMYLSSEDVIKRVK